MFNREAQRLCGKTAAEAIGADDGALFPAVEAAMLQASDGLAMESGRVIRTEETLTTVLGRRVFLSTRGPLHDAEGAVVGVIGIARDITERKQAEEALRASEQRWIMAIEGAGHGVWDWNLVDDTAWLSEQWAAMLGHAPGEIGGGTSEFFGRLHPEDAEACRQALDAHLRGAAPMYRSEVRLRCRDGSYRWVLVQGRLVSRTRDGRPLRMIGTQTDVSASHAVREELRKLWLAVEQSPNSIMITDAQARIEYVNDALCSVSGFARGELLGRNPRILHSGRTPASTYQAMWETLSRGQVWKGELVNRRPSGEVYVEFALISPVRQADGSVTHYLAIKEDITERKRIGQELDRHRHRLEELVAERTAELAAARRAADVANQAKSAFLANMSHEIRTPMNAIVGLTHLLRREEVTPAQAARLEGIEAAVRFLLSIVNDVLDLSKIEAGRIELESTEFSPGEVLRSVHDLVAEQARTRGLALRVETGDLPATLMGDPTRLRQALLNFASNAVKFTERGGIVLRAGRIQDAPDARQVRLSFEVEDTGIGIDPDQLARIFEPFEQGDGSTSRRFGGTGLGLAITRRLVRLMGGEVAVRSVPGQGSVFSLTVPFDATPSPASAAGGAAPADPGAATDARELLRGLAGRARILVADDDPVNREVATALLQDAGLGADAVGDGLAALEAVQRRRYDLVLIDLHMPGLDGLEATRRIRALPGPRLPVVALTASAFAEDRAACLAAGMDDFLAKPVDPAVLHAALWRILGARTGAGEGPEGGLPAPAAGESAPAARTPHAPEPASDAPAPAPAPAGAGASPGDPGALARRYEALRTRLEALLGQGDLAAGALARTERQLLEQALGGSAPRFFEHLAAYDHDAALRVLAAPTDALECRSPTPMEE
jgi:PAS domain S-box-containing protein